MSNPVGLSIPMGVGSGSESESESVMSPTISSLLVWLRSGSFANLIIAAEKLAEEHDSLKVRYYLANELKSLPEYIRKMVEKISETFNDSAKLREMHKEDEKRLWERVKSEILITMTLCDELAETFQLLASQIRDAEKDEDYLVNGLFDSFTALSIVNDRLKDIFRLLSSEMTFQDRLKTSSVIVVKTHDTFLRQLDLARMSDGLMVMLFLRSYESYSKALLKFLELSNQYHYDHGEECVKFLAVRMQVSARLLKVKHYPTAVVMKGDKEVGRVGVVETGFLAAVFAGLKLILDHCLEEDDDSACKFDGVKTLNEKHDWLEKGVVSYSDSD